MTRRSLLLLLSLAALGCEGDVQRAATGADVAVVDSALPASLLLDRFRADLPQPARLTHGAPSRERLVQAVVQAIEAADTAALETLAVDRAEFAWLYFPHAPVARPPYELPPGVAWLQIQQNNRSGVLRALRALGGRDLGYAGHRCAEAPQVQGQNRIWIDCEVTLAPAGETPQAMRLFGAILERDGRFAILSYANDF